MSVERSQERSPQVVKKKDAKKNQVLAPTSVGQASFGLVHCYKKYGLQISSIDITWEYVKMQNAKPYLRPTKSVSTV